MHDIWKNDTSVECVFLRQCLLNGDRSTVLLGLPDFLTTTTILDWNLVGTPIGSFSRIPSITSKSAFTCSCQWWGIVIGLWTAIGTAFGSTWIFIGGPDIFGIGADKSWRSSLRMLLSTRISILVHWSTCCSCYRSVTQILVGLAVFHTAPLWAFLFLLSCRCTCTFCTWWPPWWCSSPPWCPCVPPFHASRARVEWGLPDCQHMVWQPKTFKCNFKERDCPWWDWS